MDRLENKIDMQKYKCETHTNELITHMCCLEDCLLPLCGKCLKQHTDKHKLEKTFPELETLDQILTLCFQKVQAGLMQNQKQSDVIHSFLQNQVLNEDKGLDQLQFCKRNAVQAVYAHFTELEEAYKRAMHLQRKSFSTLQYFEGKLADAVKELDGECMDLQSPSANKSLQRVKVILQRDYLQETQSIAKECASFMQHHEGQAAKLRCEDEQNVVAITRVLKQYITLLQSSNIDANNDVTEGTTMELFHSYNKHPRINQNRTSPGSKHATLVSLKDQMQVVEIERTPQSIYLKRGIMASPNFIMDESPEQPFRQIANTNAQQQQKSQLETQSRAYSLSVQRARPLSKYKQMYQDGYLQFQQYQTPADESMAMYDRQPFGGSSNLAHGNNLNVLTTSPQPQRRIQNANYLNTNQQHHNINTYHSSQMNLSYHNVNQPPTTTAQYPQSQRQPSHHSHQNKSQKTDLSYFHLSKLSPKQQKQISDFYDSSLNKPFLVVQTGGVMQTDRFNQNQNLNTNQSNKKPVTQFKQFQGGRGFANNFNNNFANDTQIQNNTLQTYNPYQPQQVLQEQINNQNNNQNQQNAFQHAQQKNYNDLNFTYLKQDQQQIKNDFVVNMHDYFYANCEFKYLHFFQPKSKFLFLFDLQQDLRSQRMQNYDSAPKIFTQIALQINFKIPRWHRSIVTPQGEIYMIGGVSISKDEEKLRSCYLYNQNNQTLKEMNSMNIPRSGHAIAYLQENIYVMGGFTDVKGFSTSCEKYSLATQKWSIIASMNYNANNPYACSFNDKWVFKFGGKINEHFLNKVIERYNPFSDNWSVVNYTFDDGNTMPADFKILSQAACVQINSTQIMVFGGTHENQAQKSDQTFLFEVREMMSQSKKSHLNIINNADINSQSTDEYVIKCINIQKLPYSEGFWNNAPLVQNQKVYALQNVSSEQNSSVVYLDRRNLLVFSKQRWKIIN